MSVEHSEDQEEQFQPIATFILKTYAILNVFIHSSSSRKTHRLSAGSQKETVLSSKTSTISLKKCYHTTSATTSMRASSDRYYPSYLAEHVQL
jgi:hypothetical protein